MNFDKNPINTLFLEDIIAEFPESKFIYLVRDPRANFLSRKEKIKKRKANIYLDCQRWRIYNRRAWKSIFKYPDRFFILKYEDLVSSPETKLKELSDFFHFDFELTMLNFHENVKNVSLEKAKNSESEFDPKVVIKYEKLSKPINTERLNAWEQTLTKDEKDIIEYITSGTANKFGYQIQESCSAKINVLKFMIGYLRAYLDVFKSVLLFYLPVSIKLARIRQLSGFR